MNDIPWVPVNVRLPPHGKLVETKIDDRDGVRNVALLRLRKNLWWMADDSMYVYYAPTHWRERTTK